VGTLHILLIASGSLFALVLLGLAWLLIRFRWKVVPALKRMHADDLGRPSTFPTVVVARARHVRTEFSQRGAVVEFAPRDSHAIDEVGVTDREVLLSGRGSAITHIPLSRVIDAALVGEFRDANATAEETLLRLTWRLGGENITSVFAIADGRVKAERVRREIHLRMSTGTPIPPMPPLAAT
jgi:hypothetical protein